MAKEIKPPKPASIKALIKARKTLWRHVSDPSVHVDYQDFHAAWEILDQEVKWRQWEKKQAKELMSGEYNSVKTWFNFQRKQVMPDA